MDNSSDDGNIIDLAQRKLSAHAERLREDGISEEDEKEIFEAWGLTAEEFGDLTYWGLEFRKGVLLQYAATLREKAATHTDESPKDALGEQMAIAVGALLISRTSAKELGRMVDKVIRATLRGERDARDANLLEALLGIHIGAAEKHPLPKS